MLIQALRILGRAAGLAALASSVAVVSSAALAGGCGTAAPAADLVPVPEPETTAVLSGPLCEGKPYCRCQSAPGQAGLPTGGIDKRYEIKLGPTDNDLWLIIDGRVLYKSRERATDCFYVDLRAGRHPVVLRARGDTGYGARLSISELGSRGGYATFDFACGAPGACSTDELAEWAASLDRYKRDIHDPCGSTKVHGVRWQSGKTFDGVHSTELQLDLELEVYEFEPKHGPGDPACKDNY